MKKILLCTVVCCYTVNAQQIGIGTRNPVATVDVVSKGTSANDKVLQVFNSDGKKLLSGLDNGNYGIGTTDLLPSAQLTVFGTDNAGAGTSPALFATYPADPQKWGIYLNPTQGVFNPAKPGFISWYFDNDGLINQYFTANNYGSFFGVHNGMNGNSGLFFAENGTTFFASQGFTNYLTTNRAVLFTNGSLRIQDENKGYVEGGNCTNPGTIAFDSLNNNFLGCAELYDTAGTNTGVKIWKKLNNL